MLEQLSGEAPAFLTWANAAFLGAAVLRTLAMTAIGCSIGFAAGMLLALARGSRSRLMLPLRLAATAYVETFRRIPFLVLLIVLLFVMQVVAPTISLLGIATIAVTLLATAFLSEIIRAGFESVPREQIEGAVAMNFTFWQMLRFVVLPQSWRVILPPAAAFVVMFIKDTSLASHLGVVELTFAGKILVNRGISPMLGFGVVLLLYFAVSYPLSRLAARLEARLAATRH